MKISIVIMVFLSFCLVGCQAAATLLPTTVSSPTAYPTYTPYPPLVPYPTYTLYPTYTAVPPQKVTVLVVVTVTLTPTPLYTPTETKVPSKTPIPSPTLSPLQMQKGPGLYLTNVDISPGIWRNDSKEDDCYWKRSTKTGDIIDNYFGMGGGTIYIAPTDFQVELGEHCGTWTYLGPA